MGTVLSARNAVSQTEKKRALVSYAAARVGVPDFPLGPPPRSSTIDLSISENAYLRAEETVMMQATHPPSHQSSLNVRAAAPAPTLDNLQNPANAAPAFVSYSGHLRGAVQPQPCLLSYASVAVQPHPQALAPSSHPMQQQQQQHPSHCLMPAQQVAPQMYSHHGGYVLQTMQPPTLIAGTADATYVHCAEARLAQAMGGVLLPGVQPGWQYA